MKFQFHNKEELKAFITLLQEINLQLESELMSETDSFKRYEISARIELLDELFPIVYKKQFNQQVKSSIKITKAVSIIIFQNRDIIVDIYTELLKNRLVETIHRNMV
jgi:hypothetical protein